MQIILSEIKLEIIVYCLLVGLMPIETFIIMKFVKLLTSRLLCTSFALVNEFSREEIIPFPLIYL